jgi:hypothetical protein
MLYHTRESGLQISAEKRLYRPRFEKMPYSLKIDLLRFL